MRMTWRQFHVYLDAFTWLLNEQSDKGKKLNRTWDLQAMAAEPSLREWKQSLLDETKRKVADHVKRHEEQQRIRSVL